MRAGLLILAVLLTGCLDASGLGDQPGSVFDSQVTADGTLPGDDTQPLFNPDDAGEGDATIADSGPVDETSAPDTVLPDTAVDSELPDTSVPDTYDAAADVPTIDASESEGGLSPSTGRVACTASGAETVCAAGDHCCDTSSGWKCASSCGFGSSSYRCDEKSDCPSGQVCCSELTFAGALNGSYCASAFICFTPHMCMATSDCPSGKVCTATKPSGSSHTTGYCK